MQELCADGVISIQHMEGKHIPSDCGTKHGIRDFRSVTRRVCAIDPVIPAKESKKHELVRAQGMGEK